MALARVPFLLLAAAGTWLMLTPPQPPAPRAERQQLQGTERLFGKLVRIKAFAWKTSVIATLLSEALVLIFSFAGLFPPSLDRPLRATPNPTAAYALTPTVVLASIVTLLAGLLRLACYRALGPFFTFELALRPRHRLVTRGPYATVRHPSYVAVMSGIVATLLLHFGRGAWFWEAGLAGPRAKAGYALGWVAVEAWALASTLARVPQEDAMLRKHFPEEWDRWAAKVRWKLIPGVF
ncbi:hypothetical protein FA95DRAFT_1610349 [Auriscalpium vulgare]|uniref:Uncharacterized protein n=1 Tax=Auriscalpium vulgare TaxID=40419 RepID=A0ACB8RDT9_9AGAM|nr:hypothetical protein FA95DRAFT_1610349 [Auriscalpium vulgare]